MQWSYRAQPYFAFVLKQDFFHGPIWGRFKGDRFSFSREIFPVSGRGFQFNPELANSWARLEAAVTVIIQLIFPSRYGEGNGYPPHPIDTGYNLVKKTKEKMLGTVLFAQKLFVLLAAELSHAVALSKQTYWTSAVMEKNPNYTLSWLLDLAASPPLDRTRMDRVGVIVDTARMHNPSGVVVYPGWRVPAFVWFATIFYRQDGYPIIIPVEHNTHALHGQLRTPESTRTMLKWLEASQNELIEHMRDSTKEYGVIYEPIHFTDIPNMYGSIDPANWTVDGFFTEDRRTEEHETVIDVPLSHHPSMPLHPSTCQTRYDLPPMAKVAYRQLIPHTSNDSHPNDIPGSPYMVIGDAYYTAQESLPEPHPSSGQFYGQTFEDFIEERREINRHDEQGETPQERDARLLRRKRACEVNQPGKTPNHKKVKVYEWQVTGHPTFLLRTAVDKDELEDIWGAYWSCQRIYNDFFNEWDLCELIPVDQSKISEEERQYKDNGDYDPILPTTRDAVLPRPSTESESLEMERAILQETPAAPQPVVDLREEDADQRQSILLTDGVPPHFYTENPKELARRQFGMVFDPPISTTVPKANWISALAVQIAYNPQHYEGDAQMRAIVDMITKTAPRNPAVRNSPVYFINPLRYFANKLDIHPLGALSSAPNPLVFRLAQGTIAERGLEPRPIKLYIIEFDDHVGCEWELALESASSVALAIREGWGSSRRTMVEHFLMHGVPFHTLARRPEQTTMTAKRLPPIYGRRIAEIAGNFRLSHFQQYQEEREAFFDSPFGRVAGRSGGILARLWRHDRSKFQRRFEEVLLGPTPYAEVISTTFDLGPAGCYIDDDLSDNMIALICGGYSRPNSEHFVYLLYPFNKATLRLRPLKRLTQSVFNFITRGMLAHNIFLLVNGEKLSWYPPPVTWKIEKKSKRWSERDESWIEKRNQEISRANDEKDASSQPISNNLWIKRLKVSSKRFEEGYEQLAAEFLELYPH
jgi:hypothetical protein